MWKDTDIDIRGKDGFFFVSYCSSLRTLVYTFMLCLIYASVLGFDLQTSLVWGIPQLTYSALDNAEKELPTNVFFFFFL